MEKIVIIMRGVPGSGKSTKAKKLAGETGVICSADDFFINEEGKYVFDYTKISNAHEECRNKCKNAMEQGADRIVIDNTNIRKIDYYAYIQLALNSGYSYKFEYSDMPEWLELYEGISTGFVNGQLFDEHLKDYYAEFFTNNNIHGVPKETILKMINKFEA